MDDVVPVQLSEGLDDTVSRVLAESLGILSITLLDKIVKAATVHMLHKDPDTRIEI